MQHNLKYGGQETTTKGMSMAYHSQALTHSTDLVERSLANGAAILDKAALRYARHRTYRTTLTELGALSNRDLADLGLHRGMIKSIAWDAALKKTGK